MIYFEDIPNEARAGSMLIYEEVMAMGDKSPKKKEEKKKKKDEKKAVDPTATSTPPAKKPKKTYG